MGVCVICCHGCVYSCVCVFDRPELRRVALCQQSTASFKGEQQLAGPTAPPAAAFLNGAEQPHLSRFSPSPPVPLAIHSQVS